MKNSVAVFFCVLFLGLCVNTAQSAEYVVQKGDVFGHIAQEVGYDEKMQELAVFNVIDPSSYAIREGQIIRYLSHTDKESAYAWAQEQLHFFSDNSSESIDYKKIIQNIQNNNFEYDDAKVKSDRTYASEILILADAWEAR